MPHPVNSNRPLSIVRAQESRPLLSQLIKVSNTSSTNGSRGTWRDPLPHGPWWRVSEINADHLDDSLACLDVPDDLCAPPWNDDMCFEIWDLVLNLWEQNVQAKGLNWSWTMSVCLWRPSLNPKVELHRLHLKGFTLSWTLRTCKR